MDKPLIKETEIYVLKKSNNTKIRIVSWNDQPPVIEKRMLITYGGELRPGRAKGFTLAEMQDIVHNWESLQKFFVAEPAA